MCYKEKKERKEERRQKRMRGCDMEERGNREKGIRQGRMGRVRERVYWEK